MYRAAVLFVIVFAMLWQSVALARPGSTVNALADQAHTALHWQAAGHHHHQDGSYHLDDSTESEQHGLCDHLSATVALLASSAHAIAPLGLSAPGGLHDAAVPDPALEGLLRPPRFRA